MEFVDSLTCCKVIKRWLKNNQQKIQQRKFPRQPDLLSAMNLLNGRLSKGQVKHRLRKKLQEEECAVRVTEALGHQGSV